MKIGSLLAVVAVGVLLSVTPSQAGWGHGGGCGGGGYYGGRGYYGGGWGRGCGYGGGWGWGGGPAFGVTIVAPQPAYYRPVYVTQQRQYVVTHSLLAAVQVRLARLGYYRGVVDGDFGPLTSKAIRNYQIDNNLRVTGQLDGRTLSSLNV